MTAAIFGLIGVIIGGLLNAAVSAWQTRRSDIAATRVGARLVFLEPRGAALAIAITEDEDSAVVERRFPTTAWKKYRESLARVLPDDDWEAVVTPTRSSKVLSGAPWLRRWSLTSSARNRFQTQRGSETRR